MCVHIHHQHIKSMTKFDFDDMNSPDPSKHVAGAGMIDDATLNGIMEKFGFSTSQFSMFGGNPLVPADGKDGSE